MLNETIVETQREVVAGLQKALAKVATELQGDPHIGFERSGKELSIALGVALDKLLILEGTGKAPEGFERVCHACDFNVSTLKGLTGKELEDAVAVLWGGVERTYRPQLESAVRTAVAHG